MTLNCLTKQAVNKLSSLKMTEKRFIHHRPGLAFHFPNAFYELFTKGFWKRLSCDVDGDVFTPPESKLKGIGVFVSRLVICGSRTFLNPCASCSELALNTLAECWENFCVLRFLFASLRKQQRQPGTMAALCCHVPRPTSPLAQTCLVSMCQNCEGLMRAPGVGLRGA